MNILITGANGQLGNEMRIIARQSNDTYIFTDVSQQEGVETLFLGHYRFTSNSENGNNERNRCHRELCGLYQC